MGIRGTTGVLLSLLVVSPVLAADDEIRVSEGVDDPFAKLRAKVVATHDAEKFFDGVGSAMPKDTVDQMKERVAMAIAAGATVTLKDNDTQLVISEIRLPSGLERLGSHRVTTMRLTWAPGRLRSWEGGNMESEDSAGAEYGRSHTIVGAEHGFTHTFEIDLPGVATGFGLRAWHRSSLRLDHQGSVLESIQQDFPLIPEAIVGAFDARMKQLAAYVMVEEPLSGKQVPLSSYVSSYRFREGVPAKGVVPPRVDGLKRANPLQQNHPVVVPDRSAPKHPRGSAGKRTLLKHGRVRTGKKRLLH